MRQHITCFKPALLSTIVALSYIPNAVSAIPSGYYDTVDKSSQQAMHSSLHQIIDDHQRFPYSSSSTDTWDILEAADQDPNDSSSVITLYRNAKYAKQGGGNSFYNREHSWPKSYGFPKDGSTNSAYTDAHHLFIADSGYNSSRSNKPYNICTSSCNAKTTTANNGRGGTTAEQNYTAGSFTAGVWETWSGRRGDVARALMYLAVRYEGGTHGTTGHSEPDLILTDNLSLIESSNKGSNLSVAYMGMRSVLIQWHKEDPVDDIERRRNDVIYSYQGNRNPFIDHPEYVDCVFSANCNGSGGDTTPPAAPTGLTGQGGSSVSLTWSTNNEADLAGYHVYRSSAGNSFTRVTNSIISTPNYTDESVAGNTTYSYRVTAVDTSSNESTQSSSVQVTTDPTVTPSLNAWINEFHYDNASSDVGEFIEVAAEAGTSLSGWTIAAYNGNNGAVYKTISLSGVVPNQSSGFGTLAFSTSGLQNGSADGFALVNQSGTVIQFLSYEGQLTATNGPASGQTSVDIGVSETTSTPVGYSLQLSGSGKTYSDFSWTAAKQNTQGDVNTNQVFSGQVNEVPTAAFSYECSHLSCSFDAALSSDSDGSISGYSWSFGDGNSSNSAQPNHSFSAAGEYLVTLTVTDDKGASSEPAIQTLLVQAAPVLSEVWINEFHYDNSGSDKGEFVEIAGTAGQSLAGWKVYGYNGSNGTVYKSISLSGNIPNQSNGYGVLSFNFSAMQNGSPDGLALVDDKGEVRLFISYEGVMTATAGAASGQTSTDVGVSETTSTPVGFSLQLSGSGSSYKDFTWKVPSQNTSNSINAGQSFN